jgi:multicomponent Na+:H+ antiporter subunit G
MLTILGGILIVTGAVFMLFGSIGVVRLPDFYARTHAATNVDTLGIFLFVVGLAVKEGASLTTGKLVLVAFFILLVNPVGTHALASSALAFGLKPWRRERKD